MITQAELKSQLNYDPETGIFTWVYSTSSKFKFGSIAGGKDSEGYWRIRLKKTIIPAHRLAWLYMTGAMPVNVIDHIDGVKYNNKWSNLREVTKYQNSQNIQGASKNNSTGFLGVTFRNNRYEAKIKDKYKSKHIGVFDTAEEAHEAYLIEKRKLHEFFEN